MTWYTGFAKTSLVHDSDSSKRFSSRVTLVSPKRFTMHNEMSKAAFYYKLKFLDAQYNLVFKNLVGCACPRGVRGVFTDAIALVYTKKDTPILWMEIL